MAQSKQVTQEDQTLGDAAVDGLLAGGGAGVLMAAYLLAAALARPEAAGAVLGRFDSGPGRRPLLGALMHLAVAGIYGMLFGLGRRLIAGRRPFDRLPGWLAGLAYGLALLAVAEGVILPGTHSPLQRFPILHFAIAHAIYGLALGVLIGRVGED